jgi:hypothetical protein
VEGSHLSDDETVAKMGHPDLDVGHPSETCAEGRVTPPPVFGPEVLVSMVYGMLVSAK